MKRDTTRSAPRRMLAQSAARKAHWRLHVIGCADPLHVGAVYPLERGELVLGRAPGEDGSALAIDDPTMSREHLVLTVRGGADPVQAEDLRSRNGTFLGGKPLQKARAGHGAVIRAGGLVAVLESDSGRFLDEAAPTPDVPGLSVAARELRTDLRRAGGDDLPAGLVRHANDAEPAAPSTAAQ